MVEKGRRQMQQFSVKKTKHGFGVVHVNDPARLLFRWTGIGSKAKAQYAVDNLNKAVQ